MAKPPHSDQKSVDRQEQRKKIAELLGWSDLHPDFSPDHGPCLMGTHPSGYETEVPFWTEDDQDAMILLKEMRSEDFWVQTLMIPASYTALTTKKPKKFFVLITFSYAKDGVVKTDIVFKQESDVLCELICEAFITAKKYLEKKNENV